MSRPLIKYRGLYFDEAADRCVESLIEWDQDAGKGAGGGLRDDAVAG